jgi:hypothetical protein
MLVLRGEIEEHREGKRPTAEPEHVLICKTSFPDAIERLGMTLMRVLQIVVVVIFFVVMLWLRRYMTR